MKSGLMFANAGRPDLDSGKRAQDRGVARLVVAPPGIDPDGLRRRLETFASEVIAKA